MSTGQRNVLIAFGITVLLWIAPGIFAIARDGANRRSPAPTATAVPEGVAAMLGALLLFVLPIDWRERRFTLTWDEAVEIDWGIVLLYGGGLAIGELAFSTGLAQAMGEGVTSLAAVADDAGADAACSPARRSCCRRRRRTPRRPT